MKCTVINCGNPVIARNLCKSHYRHFNHFKQLNYFPTERRHWGEGTISKWGYKIVVRNRKQIFEHRNIVEINIGRKLKVGESVHHIDGNKLNNSLGNLEVILQREHIDKHRLDLLNGRKKKDKLMILDWATVFIPIIKKNKGKICFINKCLKPAQTKGLCIRHKLSYYRYLKRKSN